MPEKTVLLIEYEASLREVLGDCLSELGGWRVNRVNTIQAAMLLCEKHQPDVILVDASTPENDALILIEQLKQYSVSHAIPIVLISARANWFTIQELRQMGFSGAISKPFNPSTLSSQVFHLMRLSQSS